jgi:hypothetical protein
VQEAGKKSLREKIFKMGRKMVEATHFHPFCIINSTEALEKQAFMNLLATTQGADPRHAALTKHPTRGPYVRRTIDNKTYIGCSSSTHRSVEAPIKPDSHMRASLTFVITSNKGERQDHDPGFHRDLGTRLKVTVLSVVTDWAYDAVYKFPDLETNKS